MEDHSCNSPYFDPNAPYDSWRQLLPHREQSGKIQFVTMRLADSLPQTVLREYILQKEEFHRKHPLPWDKATYMLYHSQFTNPMEEYLDRGMGSCILRNSDTRKIVTDAFDYFNGIRYYIFAYVIMPNHIHILMLPYEGYNLKETLSSLKRFTARKINSLKGNTGRLWEEEYFDRLIRSHTHYRNRVEYIRNNPRNLPSSDYTLGGPEFEK